jgi:hypothetical protein
LGGAAGGRGAHNAASLHVPSVSPKLHAFQVFSRTVLVSLAMLAIAGVGPPFRGWVHISDFAFVRAQEDMKEIE